jgi:hypothetical protein
MEGSEGSTCSVGHTVIDVLSLISIADDAHEALKGKCDA